MSTAPYCEWVMAWKTVVTKLVQVVAGRAGVGRVVARGDRLEEIGDQRRLRRPAPVDGGLAHPGPVGHRLHREAVVADLGEQFERRLQDGEVGFAAARTTPTATGRAPGAASSRVERPQRDRAARLAAPAGPRPDRWRSRGPGARGSRRRSPCRRSPRRRRRSGRRPPGSGPGSRSARAFPQDTIMPPQRPPGAADASSPLSSRSGSPCRAR